MFSKRAGSLMWVSLAYLASTGFAAENSLVEGHLAQVSDLEQRQIALGVADGVLPQLVDGAGWQTTIILTNLRASVAHFRVFFLQGEGSALTLTISGLGSGSVYTGMLNGNQTLELATVGTSSELVQGYALLFTYDGAPGDAGAAVILNEQIGGYGIFRFRAANRPDIEAVVPLSPFFENNFVIPFDNRDGFSTGIAIINTNTSPITVTITARRATGNTFFSQTITMETLEKQVFSAPVRFTQLAGEFGTLRFSTTALGIAALGLRFNPTVAFSSSHALSLP